MRKSLVSLFGRRRADGDRIAGWHAQNLNERRHGPDGPMWRHGRAWFHWWGLKPELSRLCLGVEWVIWRPRDCWFRARLSINDAFGEDYDLSGSLSLPWLGAFYWYWEGLWPKCLERRLPKDKEFKVELYQEYLWVDFWWSDPAMNWGRNTNRFPAFHLSINWKDLLLGKERHELKHLTDWQEIVVPMPEGSYRGKVRIEQRTWSRPRWPWKRVRTAADIDMIEGVPVPGKGENSWDCGEDAIMGMGSEPTVPDAIAAVVRSALRDRERYGGSVDWRPRERVND